MYGQPSLLLEYERVQYLSICSLPHDLNIWIAITSKVRMWPICAYNIFVNSTLNSPPKLLYLFLASVLST